MKNQVWKFEIEVGNKFKLTMPENSFILDVQIDQKTEKPCIWVLVNPENKAQERFFDVVGTGHDIDFNVTAGMGYVGTFQLMEGRFVGHLFEIVYF